MGLKITFIDNGKEYTDYSTEDNFIDNADKLAWIAGYQRDYQVVSVGEIEDSLIDSLPPDEFDRLSPFARELLNALESAAKVR